MTSASWEVIFFVRFNLNILWRNIWTVPKQHHQFNITSPLPRCMLLSGLSVFDSYFPSASCGHVSPSSVPPLHVCVVCSELLGGAWGIWRADRIYTCKSSAHFVADHVIIQLLTLLQFYSLCLCPASFAKPLENLKFPRSTHLTSFMSVYHQPTLSGILGITCSHYLYFWLWTRNLI